MKRLDEIAEEMMDLIDAPSIFGFLDDSVGNMEAVEKRLQEVLHTKQQFECIELAMYLRVCETRKNQLPTWQPLLSAAVEMANARGEPVSDLFYGLLLPKVNTESL